MELIVIVRVIDRVTRENIWFTILKGNDNVGKGRLQPAREVTQLNERVHCYTFLGKIETKAYDTIIIGNIPI